jgi:hypothetical protein
VRAAESDGAATLAGLSADEVAALEALWWMVESVAGVRDVTTPPPQSSLGQLHPPLRPLDPGVRVSPWADVSRQRARHEPAPALARLPPSSVVV